MALPLIASLLTRAGWKQLGKVVIARHWEWLLIALLLVGGWGAIQSFKLVKAQLSTAKTETKVQEGATALVAADLVRERAQVAALVAERREIEAQVAQSTKALRARERQLHELRQATERAQSALDAVAAAVPDGGCRMPAAALRVLHDYYAGNIAAPQASAAVAAELGAAADPAPATAGFAYRLAGSQPLHAAADGVSEGERDRQGDRKGAAAKGR